MSSSACANPGVDRTARKSTMDKCNTPPNRVHLKIVPTRSLLTAVVRRVPTRIGSFTYADQKNNKTPAVECRVVTNRYSLGRIALFVREMIDGIE